MTSQILRRGSARRDDAKRQEEERQQQQEPPSPSPTGEQKDDASAFKPTCILYIKPHNSFTSQVKIHYIHHDLTVAPTYGSKEFEDLLSAAENTGRSIPDSAPPAMTIVRQGFLRGAKVYKGAYLGDESSDSLIATWKTSHSAHGTNIFSFSQDVDGESSQQHDITLRPVSISKRAESFTKDSVEYIWRFDGMITKSRMTLVEKLGGRESVVAKYKGSKRMNTGGIVVVDEEKLDVTMVPLTCCGMLRKVRQRN